MKRLVQRLIQCFVWLFRGQFFVLFQAISAFFVPKKWFGMEKFVFYRLARRESPLPKNDPNVEIFPGNEETVREMVHALYPNEPEMLEFYEKFFRNGVEPWTARCEGKIVGVVWLFTEWYLLPWEGYDAWLLQLQVEPTAKFVANVFVDPACRGRGIFALIAEHCFKSHPESEFYSCIVESNVSSIKAHEKVGFRRFATASLFRIFQRTRCFFKPKRGEWGFFRMVRGVPHFVSLGGEPFESRQ